VQAGFADFSCDTRARERSVALVIVDPSETRRRIVGRNEGCRDVEEAVSWNQRVMDWMPVDVERKMDVMGLPRNEAGSRPLELMEGKVNVPAHPLDGEEYEFPTGGQRWASSWHSSTVAPAGRRHGSAGIGATDAGEVVLVSADGASWDFPAGRPEGNEDRERTLRREMLEEACAAVTSCRLLGFCRGRCVEGAEAGLALVRSIWLARVNLLDWQPQFETRFRCVVRSHEALARVPAVHVPIWSRALIEAELA
jgi:hypothetical protein